MRRNEPPMCDCSDAIEELYDALDWMHGAAWALGALLSLGVAIQGYDLEKRILLYEDILNNADEAENIPEAMHRGSIYTLSTILFSEQERETIFGETQKGS